MQVTNRTTHDVQQGTGPWLRLREGFDTASEAPAALGVGKYTTRAELLRQKYTGLAADHSAATLGKFEAGHAAEARARPMAETFIEAELFPVTMSVEVDGLKLLASLDGQTMDDSIIWETKLWNEELAADVRAGTLSEHYLVQMDQELLVSGAERCLFTCTDGTPERFVSCWHHPSQQRFDALIDGWRRFHADLAAYELPPAAPAAPVGKAPETLPALRIEIAGAVTASNLAEFKATAMGAIRSVNRELTTDQHFADAEKAVKWCGEVESRLKAAKEHALSQTADIDALFKALDEISTEARTVRLDLEKLVTRRKAEVKEELVINARADLARHIETLNAELAPHRLPSIAADFAGAIKGLKSVDSIRAKLDSVLVTAKVAAESDARAIRSNAAMYAAEAIGHEFLFADLGSLIYKAADDLRATIQSRILAHKAAEEAKARAKADAEAKEALAAEAKRLADEAAAAQRRIEAGVAMAEAATCRAVEVAAVGSMVPPGQRALAAQAQPETGQATLTVGAINERLAPIKLDAAGLAALGVNPAETRGAAKLYREEDFERLLRGLAKHIETLILIPA